MIRVEIVVSHGSGEIRIEEADGFAGQTEGAVIRALERLVKHAHERARCAVLAETKKDA